MELAAEAEGKKLSAYCIKVLSEASGYKKLEQDSIREKTETGIAKKKDTYISMRINADDKAIIEKLAEKAGISTSEFMIRAAMGEKILVLIDGKDILHQLSKIGTNLNQLTILVHKGKIACPDLTAINQTLNQMLKQMIRMMK